MSKQNIYYQPVISIADMSVGSSGLGRVMPWLLALVIILANATSLKGEVFVPRFLSTVEAFKLEINIENKVKNRIHKCEADGIHDIRNLTSPFEEFWAFIPSKCTWIELGILEEIRGGIGYDRYGNCRPPSTVSGIKRQDVKELFKEISELVFYHPHPTNLAITNYFINARGAGNLTRPCLDQAKTETLEAALPGIPDLSSLLQFSTIFYGRHPHGRFVERIVSAYGITEYAVTERGKMAIQNGAFASEGRRELRRYLTIRNTFRQGEYRASGSPEINARKINKQLNILNAKDGIFHIKFRPFDQ